MSPARQRRGVFSPAGGLLLLLLSCSGGDAQFGKRVRGGASDLATDGTDPITLPVFAGAPALVQGLQEVQDADARKAFSAALRISAEDAAAAARQFERAATQIGAPFPAALYNAGVLYLRAGEPGAARARFERVLATTPGYAPAFIGLAHLAERNAGGEDIRKRLEQAVAHDRESPHLKIALAQLLARRGELDRALDLAIDALKLDERSAPAMVTLGMIYRRQKKYEIAELALNRALEIASDSGEADYELGLVYWEQNDQTRALSAFEKAAVALPYAGSIQNNLGAVRNAVGNYRGAEVALRQAIAVEGDNPHYYLNLGNSLRGQARYEDAELAFRKALEVGKGAPEAYFNLGVLYLDTEIEGKDGVSRYKECVNALSAYLAKAAPSAAESTQARGFLATAEEALKQEERRRARDGEREGRSVDAPEEKSDETQSSGLKNASGAGG